MSVSKNTIIFTAIFASIFLLFTGLVVGLKCCYCEFMLYDLLITIFGGIFASTLVVMVCEIQKYLLIQRRTEDELYGNMTNAFANAMIMKNTMDEVINRPDKPVVKNSLTQCSNQLLAAIFYVSKIDYVPFKKGKNLLKAFKVFSNDIVTIEKYINNCVYFNIAINQDKITALQRNPTSQIEINGTHVNIATVAKILRVQFQAIVDKCETFLSAIDYSKRYNFQEQKSVLQQRSDIFVQNHSLENFLATNLTTETPNTDTSV